jgi:hypothetical protein
LRYFPFLHSLSLALTNSACKSNTLLPAATCYIPHHLTVSRIYSHSSRTGKASVNVMCHSHFLPNPESLIHTFNLHVQYVRTNLCDARSRV